MAQPISHRILSLTMALAVTLGMLSGIDTLSQTQSNPAAQWVQQVHAPRA